MNICASETLLEPIANELFSVLLTHMNLSCTCVAHLKPFLLHVYQHDWPAAQTELDALNNLKEEMGAPHRAAIQQLALHLSPSVPSLETMALLCTQAKLANKVIDICQMVMHRKITIPAGIQSHLLSQTDLVLKACQETEALIGLLDVLSAQSAEANYQRFDKHQQQLADIVEQSALSRDKLHFLLSNNANVWSPVDLMFMRSLSDKISDLSGMALNIAKRTLLFLK